MRRWWQEAACASAATAIALLCVALALSGCGGASATSPQAAPSAQRTHTVVAGETVYHIAQLYGVSVGRLMTANGLGDPRELYVGQRLIIPGQYQSASLAGSDTTLRYPYSGERESRQFMWPVYQGVVSSGFGIRNGAMHEGVDIAAPAGTPVHAVDSGAVIFAGSLHGYGNTVIIRHDDHYATVYGHNYVNLVHEGDHVARGQTIAEIGRSGRTSGANLHFEVRRDNVARNPLGFLPEPAPASGITFAVNAGS
ncbi:MAG TPA: M23 family metallopeptidase [Candidatus Binataceae bacterium]